MVNYPFSGILVRFDSNTSSNVHNELHVNLWDFESSALLDIGIMIDVNEKLNKFFIDVPWDIQRGKIFDIAARLDGERILQSIFNRLITYTSNKTNNPVVRFPGSKEPKDFILVRLNPNKIDVKNIDLPNNDVTTRISIELDKKALKSQAKAAKVDKLYVRLRLLDVKTKVFSTPYSQKDKNILSSSFEATVIDFRINSKRGVPQEVLAESDTHSHFPKFKKIHLFIVEHRDKEPTFQNSTFKECRSLEDEDIWNDYIKLDGNNNQHHIEDVGNYLGYQWTVEANKTENNNDDYVYELIALARFSKVVSNVWIIMRFLIVVLLLGAVGSAIWDFLLGISNDSYEASFNPFNWALEFWYLIGLIILAILISLVPENSWQILIRATKSLVRNICKWSHKSK